MERWVFFGASISLGSLVLGLWLVPFTGMTSPDTLPIFMFWVTTLLNAAAVMALWKVGRLMLSREARPLARLRQDFPALRLLTLAAGFFLAALNITAFGLIKPQLGQLVAFSYDRALADLDRLLFLGVDPWVRLSWFRHQWLPQIYHQAWFAWVFLVLFAVMRREPSREKDALLISYFALWSIFGPLVHLLIPAAGPVFYDNLGLGDRFAAIPALEQTRFAEMYLWQGFSEKEFGPAGGISAMPSLHIATMVWTVLAVRGTRWMIPAVLLTVYMWFGSIVIGWHYATDGIVGGIGAVLCYAAVTAIQWRTRSGRQLVASGLRQ